MITVRINKRAKSVLVSNKGPMLIDNGIKKGLEVIGKRIVTQLQAGILSPPKTGRIYRYKGRSHQASAPGEYPAERSGTLRKAANYKILSRRKMSVGFKKKAYYALFLEEGTSKMKKRKLLLDTIKQNKPFIKTSILSHVRLK